MYKLLRGLLRIAVYSYFKRVRVIGNTNIPKGVPIIFACNHPSAFMDPILVAAHLPRKVHFLAGADFFFNKAVGWIFKQLWMIPVYRPNKMPGQGHKNAEVFKACYDHLGKRGAIMIFPEGVSITEHKIKPVKTGASRIMFGAESIHNFELGAMIIPIGLHYTNPHQFQSEVVLNIGDPITAAEYHEKYQKDDRETVVELTDRLELELKELTHHVDKDEIGILTDQIKAIYGHQLREEIVSSSDKSVQDFRLSKEINDALTFFSSRNPFMLLQMRESVNNYVDLANELGFSDWKVRVTERRFRLIPAIIYTTLTAPIILLGYIGNFVPYELTGFIGRRMKSDSVFKGSFMLTVGFFLFCIWYACIFLIIHNVVGGWMWPGIALATAMSTGYLTPFFVRHFRRLKLNLRFTRLMLRRDEKVLQLIAERNSLHEMLEGLKDEYLGSPHMQERLAELQDS